MHFFGSIKYHLMSQADKFTEDEVKHITPTLWGVRVKAALLTCGVQAANMQVQRPFRDLWAGAGLIWSTEMADYWCLVWKAGAQTCTHTCYAKFWLNPTNTICIFTWSPTCISCDLLQVNQMFTNFPLDVAGNLDYKNLCYVITHGEDKEQEWHVKQPINTNNAPLFVHTFTIKFLPHNFQLCDLHLCEQKI